MGVLPGGEGVKFRPADDISEAFLWLTLSQLKVREIVTLAMKEWCQFHNTVDNYRVKSMKCINCSESVIMGRLIEI